MLKPLFSFCSLLNYGLLKIVHALIFFLAIVVFVFSANTDLSAAVRIVALVNDQPVTSYDVSQRVKILRLTRQAKGNVKKQALNEIIDDILKLQVARSKGIHVDDKRLNLAYSGIARNARLSVSKLNQVFRANGIKPSSFKQRLKAQMVWSQIIPQVINTTVRVAERDVNLAMRENSNKDKTLSQYEIQQIIFVLSSANPSVRQLKQKEREANRLRARFSSCDEGLKIARGLRNVVVKRIGRKDSSQLPPGIAKDIAKTPVGRTLKPLRTEKGIELIAICDKRQITGDAQVRNNMLEQLKRKRASHVERNYIQKLRQSSIIQYR